MSATSAMRLALRALAHRRAYSLMVIAILGLGIGANAAMFGVVDAVLLRSLPYADPPSLVVLFADGTARSQGSRLATTPGAFGDWREQSGAVFTGVAALRNVSPRITNFETPIVPLTHAVTANYFDVLGAAPLLGRAFRPDEDAPGRDAVVMLSYGLWQSKFGGDRSIVGRPLDLDGRPHIIVGVMGPDFYSAHLFNIQPDLWIPTPFERERDDRSTRDVLVYARLRPDVTIGAAQSAMRTIASHVAQSHPDTDDRWSISVVPLREHVVGGFTRLAALVLSAVALVLVIACANVANLALARGLERTGDVAVRTALGASQARIVGELLTENLLLAALGGAVGVLVAWFGMPALVHLIPASAGVPFLNRVAVDWRVLTFELAITIACAALSGALPAWQATRLDVVEGLRAVGRGSGGLSRSASQWRRVLVAAEVAMAVVVVSCATLMTRTLVGLERVPTGFRDDRIATLRTSLRGDAFNAQAARVAHFEELQRRLAAVPSVASVSGVSFEPPTPAGQIAAVRLRLPDTPADAAAMPSAVGRVVLADYFDAMGIPIVKGRGITRADRAETAPVVVISESMARRYFAATASAGGAAVDPIGRTFSVDRPRATPMQIVGVVGDVLTAGVDPAAQPTFYIPYAQNAVPVMTMVMRVGAGSVAAPLREAERIAWSVSPFTNVYGVQTMEARLTEVNWRPRFAVVVLGGFATLGLLLAAAGLYAVVAYGVVQRRSEIGLRMALGADTKAIVSAVTGDGIRTVLAGVAVGDLAALLFTRTLSSMLYGVSPDDPLTIAAVSVGMLAVALCACVAPAISAARINPQTALRT